MDIRTISLLTGGRFICTPRWTNMEPEYLDCHRLYFALDGRAEFLLPGKTWRIDGGFVYLLPGYMWGRRRCTGRLEVDWLHFRPESLEMDGQLAQLGVGLRWPISQWSFWKSTFACFQERFNASTPPERSRAAHCQIQSMLLWMFSQLPARKSSERGSSLPTVEQLKPALDFIDRNFLEDPSLDEIAASVHLSRIYFHRCFKQTFHTTPHTYLMRKRMQRAWDLLRNESVSVREVSERLRFGNPFYFSRAFRRFFGVNPIDVKLRRVSQSP